MILQTLSVPLCEKFSTAFLPNCSTAAQKYHDALADWSRVENGKI